MAYTKSLLWEIKSKEHVVSYLFGSIHIGGFALSKLKSSITPYIQSCDSCATEINIKEATLLDLSDYQLLMSNVDPRHYISIKKWEKLHQNLLTKFDFDLHSVQHFKPLIILNLLVQKLYVNSNEPILDEWIWEYSFSINKNMQGLETVQDHYDTLNKIDLKEQYRIFYKSLSNNTQFRKKFAKLFEFYKKQDIRYLYKQAKRSSGKAKHLLLTDRNEKMTNVLESLLQKGSVFAAVGAAHLYGKNGMLNLIKSKSYKIKPMDLNIL
ncbi:MAG: TraB/GumN family protein [Saprospiraceae bacterium]